MQLQAIARRQQPGNSNSNGKRSRSQDVGSQSASPARTHCNVVLESCAVGNASGKSKSKSKCNTLGVGGNSNGNSNDNTNDNNDDDDDDVDGGNRSGKWEGHNAGGLISPPCPHPAKARQPSGVCVGSPGGRGSSRRKASADREGHSAGGLVNPSIRFRAQGGESAREVTDPTW